jgi:hypothetical protein
MTKMLTHIKAMVNGKAPPGNQNFKLSFRPFLGNWLSLLSQNSTTIANDSGDDYLKNWR